MASVIHRINFLSRRRGLWFSFSISLYLPYLPLLYVEACLHACRSDRREDLGRVCLCRVQVLKRWGFRGFFSFLSSDPCGGRDALWDQLSCLLGSTPCNALLLPVLSETMSMAAAWCAWGGDRWPQERERWAGLLGFWRWERETKPRGIGLSHQPLYRP